MDPLLLLREWYQSGRPVVEDGDNYVFGEFVCPKRTLTSFRNTHSTNSDYYTLESLHFLLTHKDVEDARYILYAKNAKIPTVSKGDRKNVIAYFSGQHVENIDKTAFVTPAVRVGSTAGTGASASSAAVKRAASGTEEDVRRKAARADAALDSSQQEIRPISEELSVEKMMELKAKKAAKKSRTNDSGTGSGPVGMTVDEVPSDPTTEIIRRERVYDTRESILRVKNKRFDSLIDKVRQANFKPDTATAPTQGSTAPAAAQKKKDAPQASQQRDTYERYNQPGAKGDSGGFQIDYTLSNLKPASANGPSSQAYVPGSIIDSSNKEPSKPKKKTPKVPIIIVPSGAKSMLTLYNVKKFLEDGVFENTQELMERGVEKPHNVVVNRKHGDQLATYRIVDNVITLKPEEWDRVVAVFVAGPEWQFKGWPIAQQPVDILAKIRGFHLKYMEDAMIDNIKKWDIALLEVSRSKRHLDPTAVFKFWQVLDEWTRKRHPTLRT